jgi:hypothetical protein
MNNLWVDRRLEELEAQIETEGKAWNLFAPTRRFYACLESGDEDDLRAAAAQLAKHLGLGVLPWIRYEWGLQVGREEAGPGEIAGGLRRHIKLPLWHVGRPRALGGILAHELAHEALVSRDLRLADGAEWRQLIDLHAIVLGAGRVLLNGTVMVLNPETGESQMLGHLSPELKIYAFRQTCERHGLSEAEANEYLTPHVLLMLEEFT